jgi:signal transduction histidine kinase
LNAEQRHQLFLAFKEALNNLIRHSGASEAHLQISATRTHLTLRLADNGRGLDKSAPLEGADGLRNMEERLRRIGGTCEVNSESQSGTSVTFLVPLPTQET